MTDDPIIDPDGGEVHKEGNLADPSKQEPDIYNTAVAVASAENGGNYRYSI